MKSTAKKLKQGDNQLKRKLENSLLNLPVRLEVIGKSLSYNFRHEKMETVCTDLLKNLLCQGKRNSMVASGEISMEDLVCFRCFYCLETM